MGVTTNLGTTGNTYTYVPTLKAKAGEISALNNLDPGIKGRIFPVFQMMSTASAAFASDLALAWGGLSIGLDGANKTYQSGTSAAFTTLFRAIGNAGVPVLPVIDVGAQAPYEAAVGPLINQFSPGLVLRVALHLFPTAAGWLAQRGAIQAYTDLLIDVGHVAEMHPSVIGPAVQNALASNPAALSGWRSVTLVSSAAPKDASGLRPGINLIPRLDWQLWSTVAGTTPGIHFGDHGIAHRDLSEPPGVAMANATVTPRYALPSEWMIRKGVSTRGQNGSPMVTQYHGHAQALATHASFGQIGNCWGDGRIQQIAALGGVGKSGGRKDWVSIGVNRHISVVCHHLP